MLEPEFVKKIVSLLENSSVEEFELFYKGKKLLVKRSSEAKREIKEVKEGEEPFLPTIAVVSHAVGYFYPSIKEGDFVKEGDKIGEVETLGIRDEVLAPADGIVEKLLSDGEVVEYGKQICLIKPQEVETS